MRCPWACLVGREWDVAPAISAWGAGSWFSYSPALVRRWWSSVGETPAVVGEEDGRGQLLPLCISQLGSFCKSTN